MNEGWLEILFDNYSVDLQYWKN